MRLPRIVFALLLLTLAVGGCAIVQVPADATATGSGIGWGGTLPPAMQPAEQVADRPAEPVAERPVEPTPPQAEASRNGPAQTEAPRGETSSGQAARTPTTRPEPRSTPTTRPEPRPAASSSASAPPSPAASAAEAPSGPAVTRVSFAERSDGRGYVVRLHTTGPVPAYRVEDVEAGRMSLTLFQTGVNVSAGRGEGRGPIRNYALRNGDGRTVLDLDLDPAVRFEARAYPDRDSHDLLLSLTYAPPPRPVAQASAPAGPSTGGGDAASAEHWRLDCIVIDAGHGGRDPGAVAHGVREKDVTLAIALRLGRLVEENLGVRVVYTRRDDRFVELVERGRIANESCGKLFVSIHGNSAANHSAHGTETYFLGLHRSEDARRVMERENSVVQLESDPSLYSGMDDAALIMRTMAQSTYLRVSEQLATHIEGQFSTRASRRSRGVKQAGFLVLWKASMPAVLVEVGFISNREEARFLSSAAGQDTIAQSIYRAIREYKQQYERGLGLAVH